MRWGLVGLVLLAGCARVPDHDLAQVAEAPSLERSVAEASGGFARGEWPQGRWWELFEDAQLAGLIERAVAGSPTLQRAQDRVEVARASAKRERAALFPHLRGNGDLDWQYFSVNGFERAYFPVPPGQKPPPATVNQIDLSLNFSYELDFWGKNRKKFQAAVSAALAEEAESSQAELMVSMLVAQAYFDWQTQCAKRGVLQEILEDREGVFFLSGERERSGLTNRLGVLSASNRVLQMKRALVAVEKAMALSIHLLNVLCGEGPDAELVLEERSLEFLGAIPLPSHVEMDLLARRPDLMAQIWRVESAAKEVGVAKAEFYPNVDLLAMGGLESLSFHKLFLWASRMGALNPAIHLPIFIGGKLRANLRAKVAAFNEMVHEYNGLLLKSAQEVADQLTVLTQLSKELGLQAESVERVSERSMLSLDRFTGGVDGFMGVLEEQEGVLNEELVLIDLQRNRLVAILQLVKALGGGYEGEKMPEGRGGRDG